MPETSSVAVPRMTLAEFLALPEENTDGSHFELSEGRLVRLSPTGRPHAHCIDRILRYLYKHLDETRFDILTGELGFILGADPKAVVRAADIAVLHHVDEPEEGLVREAPIVVIEVVSPSNDPEDLEAKRLQYLEAGAKEIWIVYDKTKTIHVSKNPGDTDLIYGRSGVFQSILGLSVEAKEIFR